MSDLSPLSGEERKSHFGAVRSVDDPIPEANPLSDERGAAMDLAEAREHAEGLVRRPVMTPSVEDWRSWIPARHR